MDIKRIVVAGSRDFNNYEIVEKYLDKYLSNLKEENEIIIISGACRGADALGEEYAIKHNMKIERFPAEWNTYGKRAAYIRNKAMSEVCDYGVVFLLKEKEASLLMQKKSLDGSW